MQKHLFCGRLLKQINDTLERQANNSLRNQGLTFTQLSALIELNRLAEKQATFKELEQILHVAQSTTAGIITRLEQKGMVESFGDDFDKRMKHVRITPLGEACCKNEQQHMHEAEKKLLAGLTQTEQEIFHSLLQKVCNTLE